MPEPERKGNIHIARFTSTEYHFALYSIWQYSSIKVQCIGEIPQEVGCWSSLKQRRVVEEEPSVKTRGLAHQEMRSSGAWGSKESLLGAEVHHGCSDARALYSTC